MAELPKLSESLRRLHALRWKDLINRYGFTGGHFKWHESRVRRREAAKPAFSLAPPPPTPLHHSGPSVTFFGSQGEPVSYENWRRQQMAAWAARENDPAVIDSIAIAETLALAKARFVDIVGDYLSVWADTNGDSNEFTRWLEGIGVLVGREVGNLWRKGEWHVAWFERACRNKLDEALRPLIEEWQSRACGLEILHLENPHLSLISLLVSGGDLNLAVTFERGEQAIATGQRALDSLQVTDSAMLRGDRPVQPTDPSVVATSTSVNCPGDAAISEQPAVGAVWEDVEISFISDERVQVTFGGQLQTYNYAEMGFDDKRTGKPNQAWEILRALAQGGGVIPESARSSRDFIAMGKRIERTRQRLIKHFHIAYDPIPLEKGHGYQCRFKIGCAPSFQK